MNLIDGDIFLRHSDQPRTLRTGAAVIGGILGAWYQTGTNKNLDGAVGLWQSDRLEVSEDPRLSYGELGVDFKFDMKAYGGLLKGKGKVDGNNEYMARWIATPHLKHFPGGTMVEESGKPADVTSFGSTLLRSKVCLVNNLYYLFYYMNIFCYNVLMFLSHSFI